MEFKIGDYLSGKVERFKVGDLLIGTNEYSDAIITEVTPNGYELQSPHYPGGCVVEMPLDTVHTNYFLDPWKDIKDLKKRVSELESDALKIAREEYHDEIDRLQRENDELREKSEQQK